MANKLNLANWSVTLFSFIFLSMFFDFNLNPLVFLVLLIVVKIPKVNGIKPNEISFGCYACGADQFVVRI